VANDHVRREPPWTVIGDAVSHTSVTGFFAVPYDGALDDGLEMEALALDDGLEREALESCLGAVIPLSTDNGGKLLSGAVAVFVCLSAPKLPKYAYVGETLKDCGP
jgi:hypothetical protein